MPELQRSDGNTDNERGSHLGLSIIRHESGFCYVANLPGVKSVNNRLEVKGERPAENSDTWVHMKVKTALLYHRNVSGFNTEVNVKDGIVTLRGEAANQAQKDLTSEYAKDVEGVKDVKNEMTVPRPL